MPESLRMDAARTQHERSMDVEWPQNGCSMGAEWIQYGRIMSTVCNNGRGIAADGMMATTMAVA